MNSKEKIDLLNENDESDYSDEPDDVNLNPNDLDDADDPDDVGDADDADDADDVADNPDDLDEPDDVDNTNYIINSDDNREAYGLDINEDEGEDEDEDEDEGEDEDEDEDELYLQKFDNELREEYIINNHPESLSHNYQEIKELCKIVRVNNLIVDDFHKTLPILTKYERTRILGQRAKQINNGSKPFINVNENIIDGYIIAEMELKEKKIPFIIRRPLPNGGLEYWKLEDLEIL